MPCLFIELESSALTSSLLWEPVQTSRGLRVRLIRARRHKASLAPGRLGHNNNESSQDAVRIGVGSAANEQEAWMGLSGRAGKACSQRLGGIASTSGLGAPHSCVYTRGMDL